MAVSTVRRSAAGIEIKLGTPGDDHPLPVNRTYESLPARLMMNAPYQAWNEEGSLIHVVAFTPELKTCKQADFYYGDRHLGSATESGDFSFRRPAQRGGSDGPQDTIRVACKDNADHWFRGELRFYAHQRDRAFERPVVYVHADRGVYRPGQTIRIRVLAWKLRGEYRPEVRRNVTIFLQNSRGDEMGGARILTDDDGLGTLEIPLPPNMPAGNYKLIAETENAREADSLGNQPPATPYRAEAPIQVRVFETPVIEVRHTLGEFLTPVMHDVNFDVSLRYLDGATFTTGRLEITLKHGDKITRLPPRTVTGAGPHHLTLTQAQLAEFRSEPELTVEIAALDGTNRRDTVQRTMRVVRNPYRATLEAERNSYAQGEQVSIALRVVDLNSVIVREKPVRLTGCGQTLEGRTDATGIAHFHWAMGNASCDASAYVEGTDEVVAQSHINFATARPMQSRVSDETIREGEPVHLEVQFPREITPVERVVHGDLTDSSGAIIETLAIPITQVNGAPVARAEIRPPSWGSMLLSLYSVGVPKASPNSVAAMGVLTDGQSLAVGAVSHLTVTLHGLEARGEPGEAQHLRVQVQRDGQPANATLGISMVDRGVLAMLDPYEHTPFDRFYDPQVKVLASTGAQTLTWPVVQRSWGVDRYDIGWLPSFGMHDGIAPETDPSVLWSQPTTRPTPTQPASETAVDHPAESPSDPTPDPQAADQLAIGGLAEPTMQALANAIGSGVAHQESGGIGHGSGGPGAARPGRRARIANRGGGGQGRAAFEERAVDEGYGADGVSDRENAPVIAAGDVQNTRGRQLIADDDNEPEGPIVVVRTGGDETSLWLPRAHAERGEYTMDVRVPDGIGEHDLSVFATDRLGGVALARATVAVQQTLYARADVPPALTQGDVATVAVVVRNTANTAADATVVFRAQGWTVEPIDSLTPHIDANSSATVRLRVTPTLAGSMSYHVETRSAAVVDEFQGHTWVRPAGSATLERTTSSVTVDHPWSAQITNTLDHCTGSAAECTANYQVMRLSVSLPDATGWDEAMNYAETISYTDAWSASAALATATQMIEWMDGVLPARRRVQPSQPAVDEGLIGPGYFGARDRAQRVMARSLASLNVYEYDDSPLVAVRDSRVRARVGVGFGVPVGTVPGFELHMGLDPFARMIEALATARTADYRVSSSRMAVLLNRLDNLVQREHPTGARRWKIARSMLIARTAFSLNYPGVINHSPINVGTAVTEARAQLAAPIGTSVRSYAEALRLLSTVVQQGRSLAWLSMNTPSIAPTDGGIDSSTDRGRVELAAREILRWQRAQVREPDAVAMNDVLYAVGVAMESLTLVNPAGAMAERREVRQFFRQNRVRWDHWYDPDMTSLAIRALLAGGIERERTGASIVIRVDGREVKRVAVNPQDPWSSTLGLRSIELNEWMPQNTGRVEVVYDGALTADVSLEVERWTRTPVSAEGLTVNAPSRVVRGAVVPVQIRATVPAQARRPELWMTMPPYARLEESALAALVASHTIESWHYQGERSEVLVMSVNPELRQVQISVPLRMQRVGQYGISAVELRDARGRLLGTPGPTMTVE